METTLVTLIESLEATLKVLKGPAQTELQSALHDHDKLPDKKLAQLAARSIDLLHETELLLEPSSLTLADYFLGHVNSKCLTAAVELKIPDILEHGSMTIEKLANACEAHQDRLAQVMRILHNNNIFTYSPETHEYGNNSTSQLLLAHHWTQWRNWVDLYGNEFYDIGRGIPRSLRETEPRMAAQVEFDTDSDMFSYFVQRGWLPRLHKTLSGGAIAQAPGILEDYPWEYFAGRKFIDIGGGGGGLVALILRKHRDVRGAILDLEKPIGQAFNNFHGQDGEYADLGDRVLPEDLIVGDFFKEIPPSELYTMKWCLHNWKDPDALIILKNIRRSIVKGPRSRFIILESILSDTRSGRLSRYGDITMMITAKGLERDEDQWRALAERSGWIVKEIHPLRNAWVAAIELIPDEDWKEDRAADSESEVKLSLHKEKASDENAINGEETRPEENSRSDLPKNGNSVNTDLKANMTFLTPWDRAWGNPFVRSVPDKDYERTNIKWVNHQVNVHDARPDRENFDLDVHGFAYRDDADGFSPEIRDVIQTANKNDIEETYYPHVKRMLKEKFNASRVEIFDHTVRKHRPESDSTYDEPGKEKPATIVHCDQSTKGAMKRLRQVLESDEEVQSALKGGVQILNVWRPINGPVQDWPLATLDCQTLEADHVHEVDLFHARFEERGHTVAVCHREGQRWYSLRNHKPEEVVIIKIWDSRADVAAKLCAHCAFKDPHAAVDVSPRESIEVRCVVFY